MAIRFVPIDRDTPLLLPPHLRDWVPDDHLVHFHPGCRRRAGTCAGSMLTSAAPGSEQYPPTMMLALLIYSYATAPSVRRRIEQSTYDSVRCAATATRIPITTRSAPSAARTRRC